MGIARFSERRTRGGDALARAILAAEAPLSFEELMAAAPGCSPGEVAAWIGNALAEGLIREIGSDFGGGLRFVLKARGRRIFSSQRRARERRGRRSAGGRPSFA
jgi:hypothetical protein